MTHENMAEEKTTTDPLAEYLQELVHLHDANISGEIAVNCLTEAVNKLLNWKDLEIEIKEYPNPYGEQSTIDGIPWTDAQKLADISSGWHKALKNATNAYQRVSFAHRQMLPPPEMYIKLNSSWIREIRMEELAEEMEKWKNEEASEKG